MFIFARNIINGWFNWLFVPPTLRTIARRKICKGCEFKKHGLCAACGCVINAKTACRECECIKGFWK
jgi:hypothetical protein